MINPFAKGKKERRDMKIRMDKGENWFFLVEGADEEEGAFSLTLDCSVGG